jgi:hypothetical protein
MTASAALHRILSTISGSFIYDVQYPTKPDAMQFSREVSIEEGGYAPIHQGVLKRQ